MGLGLFDVRIFFLKGCGEKVMFSKGWGGCAEENGTEKGRYGHKVRLNAIGVVSVGLL